MSDLTHRRLRALFSTDASLTVLLVSLSLVLFVIYPFVPLSTLGRLLVDLGLTAIVISGSFSLADRPHLRMLVVGLAIIALVTHWLRHVAAHEALLTAAYSSTILFLGLAASGTLSRVLRQGRVTSHRIQGAIAVYLMLGLIWGFAYSLVELHHPGSFNLPGTAIDAARESDENMRDLVYFSFVTLTTLGYGDIAPKSPHARTLATLEALVGQLYLVILIARLVSLWAAEEQTGDPPA